MADNDTHYNGTDNSGQNENLMNGNMNSGMNGSTGNIVSGGSNIPVIPLPEEGAGGPVYSAPNANVPMIPLPDANIPIIPLPEEGAGGPVWPNNPGSSGNRPGSGGNRPGSGGNRPGSGQTGSTIIWPNINWFPNYPNFSPQYYGQVRFLNASANTFPVTISIDGTAYAINSRFGTVSNYDWISDGFHTVTVRRASGLQSILLQQNFPFTAGQKVTMVLTDSASGGLDLIRVIDSGCSNLPYNSGCYRFANMTYSGSRYDLLLYGGNPVFRNVGFQTVTSYKQSVAGTYQFYVTNSTGIGTIREIPIIILGSTGTTTALQEPLVSFEIEIAAGQNYTTYLIGNTWSDIGLRALTVSD